MCEFCDFSEFAARFTDVNETFPSHPDARSLVERVQKHVNLITRHVAWLPSQPPAARECQVVISISKKLIIWQTPAGQSWIDSNWKFMRELLWNYQKLIKFCLFDGRINSQKRSRGTRESCEAENCLRTIKKPSQHDAISAIFSAFSFVNASDLSRSLAF